MAKSPKRIDESLLTNELALKLNNKSDKTHKHDGTYQPIGDYANATHMHYESEIVNLDRYTKEETDQRIAEIIGTAPENLDTLQELADALNNDENFASTITNQLNNKVDKVQGQGLSDENYTLIEKQKLAGIEEGANKYTHPSNHSADIITENTTKRFVSDVEKESWNAKETSEGAQAKANTAETNAKAYTDIHDNDTVKHITSTERTNWDDASSKKHSHGNKSILDTITQALIDAWNSAVTHISDTIKHVTQTDKDTWNTVTNKTDKSYVDTELTKKADKIHNHDNDYAAKATETTVSDHETRLFNIESGYSEGHTHANLSVLDSITQLLIDKWNTVTGKADKSYVDTELASKADSTTVSGHTGNSTIHVTQTNKDNWNNKQDALGFTPVPNTRKIANKALSADITLTKADVELGNVDNIQQATKAEFNTHNDDGIRHIASAERTNWNDANTKKHEHSNKSALDLVSGTNTGDETTTTVGSLINGATAKTTPVDTDMVGLMDSGASNILKKLSWANIKVTLKTYFDGLYALVGHNHNLASLSEKSYNSLTDKPTKLSQFTNDNNFITSAAMQAALNEKSDTGHTHTKSQITDFPSIPTKTSDLTNDSGFITSGEAGTKIIQGTVKPETDTVFWFEEV